MTLYNNACISFNKKIPAEAMEKLNALTEHDPYFKKDFIFEECDDGTSAVSIDEALGDLTDELNEIVEIIKPYGVAPLIGEYNRYYGDYDGYDVFTGERFESMDDVEYGGWLVRDTNGKYDELIRAARELVDYFQFHNKNCTKAQDERVENLKTALAGLGKA